MRKRTVFTISITDDSGESNRPCSPRPRNNLVPLCRPIQRYGSRSGRIQLVSGSGKGQNLNNLFMYYRDRMS